MAASSSLLGETPATQPSAMFEAPSAQSTLTSAAHLPPLAEACPVVYDSEYRWCPTEVKGRRVWHRKMDGIANFILHWQYRFHNHGDIYVQGLLTQRDAQGTSSPLAVSAATLREAMRRMRTVHPFVAVEGRQRGDLGVPAVPLPHTLRHLNLQMVLAYTVPQSEADIDAWLDDVVQVHDDAADLPTFYHSITRVDRASTYTLRFHLWEADTARGTPARLILEQSHVLSDGGGLLTTFDEVLSFIALTLASPAKAAITWGGEVARLPPSLQDAVAHPPASWDVTKKELKQIERHSRARMSGKATKPNTIDKLVDRVLEVTLANNASKSKVRRGLNRPLAKVVQAVAQTGEMFPIGLLPNADKPFNGPWTHCDYFEDVMTRSDTSKLLASVKRHNLTLAPVVEAAMAFATTWVRRQRGLTQKTSAWDSPVKVIGSFSNAVNKRDKLVQDHQRYLGLAMAGIVTKISAGDAQWSDESIDSAIASPLDSADRIPAGVSSKDLAAVLAVARKLGEQYRVGRADENWLKYDKATMLSAMQAEYMCLSNEAFYPSHPWLSSPGRLEGFVAPSRPISTAEAGVPFSPAQFNPSEPSSGRLSSGDLTLEVDGLRMIGRANLSQPLVHQYSFRGEMTTTVSYASWLYDSADNGRRSKRHGVDYAARASILPLWFSVVRLILQTLIDEQPA